MSGNLKFALLALLLCFTASVSAQTVSGVVKDNTGEPIIGATVVEDGNTSNGAITDLDGNYTLTLQGNSKKLVFSYVGMKSQTIAVAGNVVSTQYFNLQGQRVSNSYQGVAIRVQTLENGKSVASKVILK